MSRRVFSRPRIRLVFGLFCGVALLSVRLLPQQTPRRLVGEAKFPWAQAFAWQQTQMNDRLPAEDRVKATIDTYFVLLNECLRTWELLDFNFLFDLNDVKAWNDYAYERGRMYVSIEGSKVLEARLTSYIYKPKYYSINISGSIADAWMWPGVDWKWKGGPGFQEGGWADHKFKLEMINGQWKIKSLYCSESEQMYPRDTDFEKEAEKVVRNLKRAKKESEAGALEDMKEIDTPHPSLDQVGISGLTQWPFNRSNFIWYAYRYSSNTSGDSFYNPYFKPFDNDCQNFVSQCLWAGYAKFPLLPYYEMEKHINNHDLPMIDNVPNGIPWWCDKVNWGTITIIVPCPPYPYPFFTYSMWTQCEPFLSYASNNGTQSKPGVCTRKYANSILVYRNVKLGDIIKQRNAKHVMIVTQIIDMNLNGLTDYNEVFISAHTNNRRDYPLYLLNIDPLFWYYYMHWYWTY